GPGYEDMQRRIPDTTLAHTLTGYHPTHTLDTIIKDVIHHHQTTQHTAGPRAPSTAMAMP
ncbi:MAG TPA: nucleoside-diphosphate sugar epimerase, partial [Streptosporangiaceae bacterium]|nr:nucleoside-diphosphate sugar epimerase [Streptosporangiaceae bacterium]